MRRLAIIILTLLPCLTVVWPCHGTELPGTAVPAAERTGGEAATPDSSSLQALKDRLQEYLEAISTEPFEIQGKEADFLISSCTDSSVRQTVALTIFDHYLNSRIMGAEAVAIHLCDEWFIPGKISMRSPEELMTAKIFARFNRSSLLGMKAPELTLKDTSGLGMTLFPASGTDSPGSPEDSANAAFSDTGRYSILYFYDTDCAKCRMETILLRNILDNDDFPADLYAIYTGDNEAEWKEYIGSQLTLTALNTRTVNLWDPDMRSGFQMKYGVLETPKMFLVSPEGIIAGRGLDSHALEELLGRLLAPQRQDLEYGSVESEKFYDSLFSDPASSTCQDITDIAGHIEARTLNEAGDTALFRQMEGDLLYYLSGKREGRFKCAAEHLVKKMILGRDDIWNTPDDTLKIVQFAEVLDELLSRAAAGTKVEAIKVHATRLYRGKTRYGEYRLDRLRKDAVIIFHTEGCPVCKAEIEAVASLAAESPDTAVLLIDMDEIFSSYPSCAETLFNSFDLTSLPYIMTTDRKGIITGKYVSLTERQGL